MLGDNALKWETFVHTHACIIAIFPQIMPPKRVLPIHTNSITQPLRTVPAGHVWATFSVSITCVRTGLTSHRVQ